MVLIQIIEPRGMLILIVQFILQFFAKVISLRRLCSMVFKLALVMVFLAKVLMDLMRLRLGRLMLIVSCMVCVSCDGD